MRLRSCLLLPCAAPLAIGCSETQPVASEGAEPVLCAVAGDTEWSDECRLETARVGGANVLVIRHPDGGFRRLIAGPKGFQTADGSAEAQTEFRNGRAFVTIDNATYSLPVTRQP